MVTSAVEERIFRRTREVPSTLSGLHTEWTVDVTLTSRSHRFIQFELSGELKVDSPICWKR